jgi:TPR repeat protein
MNAGTKRGVVIAFATAWAVTAYVPAEGQEIGNQLGQAAASDYRYAKALADFQEAARQGNREAQKISGLMLLYGEKLYGEEVRADQGQAIKWLTVAAAGGCEVSAHLLRRHASASAGTP